MTTIMSTMAVDELRALLESTWTSTDDYDDDDKSPRLLLLDCRPFLTYNEAHISSAVNAYCPSILLRRRADRGGKLPFHVLIPSAEVRDRIRRGFYSTVVLYDESGSQGIAHVNVANVNAVVTDSGLGKNVFYLDGGFQRFRQTYPQLCVESHASSIINSTTMWSQSQQEQFQNEDGRQQQCVGNYPVYEQGDPVEILEHLFLGSAFHAANVATLDRLGVTALINVSRSRPALDADAIGLRFAYKSIPIDDSNSVDISSWFDEAIQFIDDVKQSGGKVLVHCHAGISRSATICLAYLMFTQRIRLDEAYEYIKMRRSIISPNFNFMGQLLKFESQLMLSPDAVEDVATTVVNNRSPRHHHHHHQHQHQQHRHRHQQRLNSRQSRPSTNVISHESCLLSAAHQQRFVFDMGVSEDRGYSSSSVASSASPMLSPSPMLTATAIMSPS